VQRLGGAPRRLENRCEGIPRTRPRKGFGDGFRMNRVNRRSSDSPSCTIVGVESLGRGGQACRGVKPDSCQYPKLTAGFRRRALFFERPNRAKSEHYRLLWFFGNRRLKDLMPSGPYVSGAMGTNDPNNRAYGISCHTRPILNAQDRFRMGHRVWVRFAIEVAKRSNLVTG
jgi:hypothetical protein